MALFVDMEEWKVSRFSQNAAQKEEELPLLISSTSVVRPRHMNLSIVLETEK